MMDYSSAEYVAKLRHDPTLTVVTIVIAAEALGITRAGVDRKIRVGEIDAIKVDGTIYVLFRSLLEHLDQFDNAVEEVYGVLVALANNGERKYLSEVMSKIGLDTVNSMADRRKSTKILSKVSRLSLARHGVDLLALLYRKTYNGALVPPDAFFSSKDLTPSQKESMTEASLKKIKRKFREAGE